MSVNLQSLWIGIFHENSKVKRKPGSPVVRSQITAAVIMVDMRECAICGWKDRLELHHRNRNKSDNRPENGVCLCRSCHVAIHQDGNIHRGIKRVRTLYQETKARADAAEERA